MPSPQLNLYLRELPVAVAVNAQVRFVFATLVPLGGPLITGAICPTYTVQLAFACSPKLSLTSNSNTRVDPPGPGFGATKLGSAMVGSERVTG